MTLKGKRILNTEPYYDGVFSTNDLVSKAFVDAEISKLPKPDLDVLKLDGSRAMTGDLKMGGNAIRNIKPFVEDDSSQAAQKAQLNDVINFGYFLTQRYFHSQRGNITRLINEVSSKALNRKDPDPMENEIDMANHSIVRLKEPQSSESDPAVNVNFVNKMVSNNNALINTLTEDKISEAEKLNIKANRQENDDDITKVRKKDRDFHQIKKTYRFKIKYDSSIHYYSTG